MSKFSNSKAQMQAVREAARRSPRDTGKEIEAFARDRLLCRVFSETHPSFILKGGQGMLARTGAARETRDVDMLGLSTSLTDSLEDLKRVAALDLDDFFSFEFVSASPIKETEEYREGLKVKFSVFCGVQKLPILSIDLVSDPAFHGQPWKKTPEARLVVGDLPVFDYLLYPIEHVIADKVCATYETYDGRPSSRVKDLVDLGIVALSETIDGSAAASQLLLEFKLRKIDLPSQFAIPREWEETAGCRQSYRNLVSQTGYISQLGDMHSCVKMVRSLINPLLSRSSEGKTWNPAIREWCSLA